MALSIVGFEPEETPAPAPVKASELRIVGFEPAPKLSIVSFEPLVGIPAPVTSKQAPVLATDIPAAQRGIVPTVPDLRPGPIMPLPAVMPPPSQPPKMAGQIKGQIERQANQSPEPEKPAPLAPVTPSMRAPTWRERFNGFIDTALESLGQQPAVKAVGLVNEGVRAAESVPVEGAKRFGRGAVGITEAGGLPIPGRLPVPTDPLKAMHATADLLNGAGQMASIALPAMAVAAPIGTATTLLVAKFAGDKARELAKTLGAPEEAQELAEAAATAAVAGFGGTKIVKGAMKGATELGAPMVVAAQRLGRATGRMSQRWILLSKLYGPGDVPGVSGIGFNPEGAYPKATVEAPITPSAPTEAGPLNITRFRKPSTDTLLYDLAGTNKADLAAPKTVETLAELTNRGLDVPDIVHTVKRIQTKQGRGAIFDVPAEIAAQLQTPAQEAVAEANATNVLEHLVGAEPPPNTPAPRPITVPLDLTGVGKAPVSTAVAGPEFIPVGEEPVAQPAKPAPVVSPVERAADALREKIAAGENIVTPEAKAAQEAQAKQLETRAAAEKAVAAEQHPVAGPIREAISALSKAADALEGKTPVKTEAPSSQAEAKQALRTVAEAGYDVNAYDPRAGEWVLERGDVSDSIRSRGSGERALGRVPTAVREALAVLNRLGEAVVTRAMNGPTAPPVALVAEAKPEEGPQPSVAQPAGTPEKAEAAPSETRKPSPPSVIQILRKSAESLARQVGAKRHPAIADQNVTARRARIASNMAREADSLEAAQKKLEALADAHEAGTVPDSLAGIRNRAQVDALLRNVEMPSPTVHRSFVRDVLEKSKGAPGTRELNAVVGRLQLRASPTDTTIPLYGAKELEAFQALMKIAEKRGLRTSSWNLYGLDNYKRALSAGIDTREKWAQARKDLDALGGKVEPTNTAERQIKAAERALIGVKIPGYFPTPKTLAERLVSEADIEPGMSVLEPSAGKGNIADAVRAAVPDAQIDVVEPSDTLRKILELKGYTLNGRDFLSHKGQYDRIVMNPPFEQGQDITHVQHAYGLLKPGGRVVAIMSEGPFFRSDKKATAFREWLEEVGGTSEQLPAGSFTGKEAERQTGAASRLVVVSKPEAPVSVPQGPALSGEEATTELAKGKAPTVTIRETEYRGQEGFSVGWNEPGLPRQSVFVKTREHAEGLKAAVRAGGDPEQYLSFIWNLKNVNAPDRSMTTPSVPPPITDLIARKEAEVRSGAPGEPSIGPTVNPAKVGGKRQTAKSTTPEVAAAKVQQQIDHVVDTRGAKNGAEVQARVIAALESRREAAAKAAGFKTVEYHPSKAYGGREGNVWVDGEMVAGLRLHGTVDHGGTIEITWVGDTPVSYQPGQGPKGHAEKPEPIDTFRAKDYTPTELGRHAASVVAKALSEKNKAGTVTFQVPGDGTFTISNNPVAIDQVIASITSGGDEPWKNLGAQSEKLARPRPPAMPTGKATAKFAEGKTYKIGEPVDYRDGETWKPGTYQGETADGLMRVQHGKDTSLVYGEDVREAVTRERSVAVRSVSGERIHEMRALQPSPPRLAPKPLREAAAGVTAVATDIRDTFVAPNVSHPARLTSRYLRWRIAQMMHKVAVANHAVKKYRNAIEALTIDHDAILDLADALEGVPGAVLPDWLKPWAKIRQQIFEALKAEQDKRGIGLQWREYYKKNVWKKQFEGKETAPKVIGYRPLKGPATYRKQKVFETMREGVEQFGKEPSTWNLVDHDLIAIEEMAKFTMAHDVREDMKNHGLWQFVSALKRPPEGMRAIPDPMGEIWAPPQITVYEAYDKLLMEGLENFIQSLGVKYTRQPTAGQSWGATGDRSGNVRAKFGGPESVLMHEIGHALDAVFDLGKRLVAKFETFEGEAAASTQLREELKALAALRYEGQRPDEAFVRYVQDPSERLANLVHAYLWAPEKAKAAAPRAFDALQELIDTTPALEQLADLQQMRSVVIGQREATHKLPGPMLLGRYYAPPDVARIFENYLKPGLGAHKAWTLLRIPANLMVQAKLGFSAFHGFVISQESSAMQAALALTEVARGNPSKALARFKTALTGPVSPIRQGIRVKHEYLDLATLDPMSVAIDSATNLLLMGGGRVEQSRQYTNRAMQKFMDNLRRANAAYLRGMKGKAGAEAMAAVLHALPALVEAAAYPILQMLVPTAKAGATVNQIRADLAKLPGEPTEETLLAVASKAVNLTDATLGEVIWDNYFLPRAFMNAVHMVIMAPGWRWGSAILLGRGLTDPVRRLFPSQRETYTVRVPMEGGGPEPVPEGEGATARPAEKPILVTQEVKEPYWSSWTSLMIATVMVQMLVSEIYQLAHNTGHVESPLDIAYPRTGEIDSNGKPERVRLPGYAGIFYDILHRAPGSAVEYALGGQAPMPTMIGQWWANETRFGEQIVDPADPWRVRLEDYVKFLAEQWAPISVSSYGRRTGTTGEKAESILGISPAPKRVTDSEAELLMREYLGATHKTRGQAERGDVSGQLSEAIREGDTARIAELRENGQISRQAAVRVAKNATKASLALRFQRLGVREALHVYDAMDERERGIVRRILLSKYAKAMESGTIPRAERPTIIERMKAARSLAWTPMVH